MASKLRFQASDTQGNRFTITFEGNVSREKILQVLDLMELLGGISSKNTVQEDSGSLDESTKLERVRALLTKKFPIGWFSSKDVQSVYEEVYNEPLVLSTVSTYLQRLSGDNFLLKSGSRALRRYKINRLPLSNEGHGKLRPSYL